LKNKQPDNRRHKQKQCRIARLKFIVLIFHFNFNLLKNSPSALNRRIDRRKRSILRLKFWNRRTARLRKGGKFPAQNLYPSTERASLVKLKAGF
jgi:hypothetical protein